MSLVAKYMFHKRNPGIVPLEEIKSQIMTKPVDEWQIMAKFRGICRVGQAYIHNETIADKVRRAVILRWVGAF